MARSLEVKRGDTWIFTAKWRDSTGAPIDLADCTVRQNLTPVGVSTVALETSTETGEITLVTFTSLGTVAALVNLPADANTSDIYYVTAETDHYIYTTSGWIVVTPGILCDVYTRVEAEDMALLTPGCYEFDQEVTFSDDRVISTGTIKVDIIEDKTI